MGKNIMGGGKNRKGARNRDIDSSSQKATRYAKEAGEIYAWVTRLFGGSNCEVKCVDNKTRLCVIRNKFRGRGKKDNTLAIGVWVLIGIRDWETTPENKLPKCDLLEVYSNTDKIRLKNLNYGFWRFDKYKNIYKILNGGWHFSFLGNPEMISSKIKSYTHLEYDKNEFTDIEKIKKRILELRDPYDREKKLVKVEINKNFPDYIKNNKEYLKDLIG